MGGTSDARFIVRDIECETLELGLMDTTMHEINEHVACEDLDKLTSIYKAILQRLFLTVENNSNSDQGVEQKLASTT